MRISLVLTTLIALPMALAISEHGVALGDALETWTTMDRRICSRYLQRPSVSKIDCEKWVKVIKRKNKYEWKDAVATQMIATLRSLMTHCRYRNANDATIYPALDTALEKYVRPTIEEGSIHQEHDLFAMRLTIAREVQDPLVQVLDHTIRKIDGPSSPKGTQPIAISRIRNAPSFNRNKTPPSSRDSFDNSLKDSLNGFFWERRNRKVDPTRA